MKIRDVLIVCVFVMLLWLAGYNYGKAEEQGKALRWMSCNDIPVITESPGP